MRHHQEQWSYLHLSLWMHKIHWSSCLFLPLDGRSAGFARQGLMQFGAHAEQAEQAWEVQMCFNVFAEWPNGVFWDVFGRWWMSWTLAELAKSRAKRQICNRWFQMTTVTVEIQNIWRIQIQLHMTASNSRYHPTPFFPSQLLSDLFKM